MLLYSCCFVTDGLSRSIIVDHQREDTFFISNIFSNFIKECKENLFSEVYIRYKKIDQDLDEFLHFLFENDLIFWTNNPELFPEIEKDFELPTNIGTAIVDCNHAKNHDFDLIFDQLDKVGCRDLQVRCYDYYNLGQINVILKSSAKRVNIKSIELLVKYDETVAAESYEKLTHDYIHIKNIIIHSSVENNLHKINSHEIRANMGNIIFTKEVINSNHHCGIISPSYFNVINISAYMEANKYNSCLHKKVGIDVNGDIKNCPSLEKVYGNIYSDDLEEIILRKDFVSIGTISKDQIDTCKECEFRYICSDCRAFVSDREKPKKCTYDPKAMEWA